MSAHLLALLALLLHVAACGPRGPPREPHCQRPLHARSGPATPALTAPPARPQSPPRPRPTRTSGPREPAHSGDPAPSRPAHCLGAPALPPRGTRWAQGGRYQEGRFPVFPKAPEETQGHPGPLHASSGREEHTCLPQSFPSPLERRPSTPPPSLALPNPSGPRGSGSNFSILPPSLGWPTSQPASRLGRRATCPWEGTESVSNPGSGRAATWHLSLFTLSHKETLF